MADKPKKVNKKMIIAIAFIVLFTISIAVVFLYPPPVSEQDKGYVNVSRGESYWHNENGNKTEARYILDYGIYGVEATPKITITDQADPNLTQIDVEQETSKVNVSYNENTGIVTVVVTGIAKNETLRAQVAFLNDPVEIFAAEEKQRTIVTPDKIYWGDNIKVNITITKFKVERSSNVTSVGVYAWLTEAVSEITNATTNPQTKLESPMFQAVWRYKYPKNVTFNSHEADYTVKIPSTERTGNVLLRTWVEVTYSTALRMKVDGIVKGAKSYFFRIESTIAYQFEYTLLSRPLG